MSENTTYQTSPPFKNTKTKGNNNNPSPPIIINVGGNNEQQPTMNNMGENNNNNNKNNIINTEGQFLISFNNQLRQELEQEKIQNNKLVRTLDTYQRDQEKFVESNKYVRGLLKNFIEIDKLSDMVVKQYVQHNKHIAMSVNQYTSRMIRMYKFCRSVSMVGLFFLWQLRLISYFYCLCALCTGIGIELSISSLMIVILQYLSQESEFVQTEIRPLKERIDEIRKSQDFLDNYIENITSTSTESLKRRTGGEGIILDDF